MSAAVPAAPPGADQGLASNRLSRQLAGDLRALGALYAFVLMTFWAGFASASEAQRVESIESGIRAYEQAQATTERDARTAAFARAERLFVQAASQGPANAKLHNNAGIAALQSERLGPAILAFRRALALEPANATALRNIAHARALLPAWVPQQEGQSVFDSFFFWHRSMSLSDRIGAAAVCFLLAALALAAAIVWRSRLARGVGVVLGIAWLALLASVVTERLREDGRHAVITADEAIARASDSLNAPVRFAQALPSGTEVVVVETRDRWARIRLANDREAWVSRASLEQI